MPRVTFREQVGAGPRGSRKSALMPANDDERVELSEEIEAITDGLAEGFESNFEPSDMRQLALVAHNHMKPAMKEFIQTYSEVLKKFRITGTQTTMRMCKTLWGEDNPDIEYGLTCTSGPLGGDAQIAALMCMEDLGALIFFVDPLSAHPHQADIDSLIRLANCGNVIVCPNPTSAMSMMHTLKAALETGSRGMIPSFFETLESPAVEEYKNQQELALAAAVNATSGTLKPSLPVDPSMYISNKSDHEDDDDVDEDEAEDTVGEMQSLSVGAPKNRSSQLYGVKMQKKKKKKGIMHKLGKSMRRLGSME